MSGGAVSLFDEDRYEYVVVDAMNMCARFHYGMKLSFEGRPTGMLTGLARFVIDMRRDYPQAKVMFLWEGGGSRRKVLQPLYKSQRPKKNADFVDCLDNAKFLLRVMGCTQLWHAGLEADDLAGWVVSKYKDSRILLVSMDADWYQFTRESRVDILVKGVRMTTGDLKRVLGYSPAAVCIPKILCGDKSDNIPGIPRFPLKLAEYLASVCTSVEALYGVEFPEGMSKWRDVLEAHRELVEANRQLIEYQPSWINDEAMVWAEIPMDKHAVLALMQKNGMEKLEESFLLNFS